MFEYPDYRSYVVGVPGNYTVKACGNNRIMVQDLPTIEAAEEWIKENRPYVPCRQWQVFYW